MTIRLLENGDYRLNQNSVMNYRTLQNGYKRVYEDLVSVPLLLSSIVSTSTLEEIGRMLENGFLRSLQNRNTRTIEGACTEATFWTCCPGVVPNCALLICGLSVSSSVGLVLTTVYATAAICCGNLVALGLTPTCTAYYSFYITDLLNNIVWQQSTCEPINIGGLPLGTMPCGVVFKANLTQSWLIGALGSLVPLATYRLHVQLWNGSPCNQASFVTDVYKQFACGF